MKTITSAEFFKNKVKSIKSTLPANWREQVLVQRPDLNTTKGKMLMDNTYSERSTADVDLILLMEKIANQPK
jgi:hypothetical protein